MRKNFLSCVNFILLVPLFWLPLYMYLHFGYNSYNAGEVHPSASRTSGNAFEVQETDAGIFDQFGRQGKENQRAIHAVDVAAISNDDLPGADDTLKWRKTKRTDSAHLHSNREVVSPVKLTVKRKSGKDALGDPMIGEDFADNKSVFRHLKRTFGSSNKKTLKDISSFNRDVLDRHHPEKNFTVTHVDTRLPYEKPVYRWSKDGPGEMGKAVPLTPEEQYNADLTFDLNRFNVVVSDRIALNRTLPDVRPPRCRMLRYPKYLPRTSVIIVFHNEAWSTLLRTITSVINRSPSWLLQEIILVDDASEVHCDWLQEPLERFVTGLPVPIRVERLGTRQGIVAARHVGVAMSKGEVLTFLDSHCECTKGWLEPLLERISKDRTRVVCPVIDSISDTTFEYSMVHGMALLGGFSWLPEFLWTEASTREQLRVNYDVNSPLRTPTMAGGLFSVHREFFNHLGGYDKGLTIWGGENLQLSFKVWQCGGSIEIVPCSHVGHIFRTATPYVFPLGAETTILHNNRRVLEVWTDPFVRELFLAMTPAYRTVDYGDVTGEKATRDGLGCKSFRWYLDNVYPEHTLPLDFQALGAIKNIGVNVCLDVIASRKDGKRGEETDAALELCHGNGPGQVFAYNPKGQIQHDRLCLTAQHGSRAALLSICNRDQTTNANQRWIYKERSIINVATRKCLDVKPTGHDERNLFLAATNDCDRGALSQLWTMHNVTIHGFS
ncbi:polypeptide N-acetylgalactosaminyltransferase 13-like [Asterias rubens]|uniref:polypeptide N-acetylgalactosaminyltransferase 13-like n=1 Tax=Asterias rubens TaxID=7604 RepID=UPI0014555373|nr:polypeptide N-acetylgalactosaminyltransferase 13-like [Asterias rubens]